jgi:hypothetical protein
MYCFSRVCHCVTATLSTLASIEEGANLLMGCPNDLALKTMLKLCEVFQTPVFERAGHVKAGACAGGSKVLPAVGQPAFTSAMRFLCVFHHPISNEVH